MYINSEEEYIQACHRLKELREEQQVASNYIEYLKALIVFYEKTHPELFTEGRNV